ncbi:hypothetical protein A3709_07470 [Halioglobus sp. HI00S01]|uniref:flagellar export chaperone FlgN n=1 Tax=Halioglobus sp. HI00S01 TaxID=1822214 RepID=UPI0007C2C1F2|nr:flagellar export chaperone FlgN [Halioglobus sp. HI00S01]KZX54857.1 hypothetical protein A3709_07470 [Halioglobus sp. HI00S01]
MDSQSDSALQALSAKCNELTALEDILTQERSELCRINPDGEQLLRIAERKQTYFHSLVQIEEQLATIQEEVDLASMNDATPDNESLMKVQLLNDLHDKAVVVSQLNKGNGLMIHERMLSNERILEFIRDANHNWIYGPEGTTAPYESHISSHA